METVDFNNEETVKIASDGVHESNNSNVESEHLDFEDSDKEDTDEDVEILKSIKL